MDVPLAVLAPDQDMALGFSGLITVVVNVCLTFAVQGGVPPITP